MPIRPVSIRHIPTSLIRPLQGVPSSASLYRRRPEPAKALLALGSDLPPNIRVQDWIHDDRQRWSGISRADRDGVYDKRTKRWVRKGLKTLLREY
jgi:hypothetical protein